MHKNEKLAILFGLALNAVVVGLIMVTATTYIA